MTDKNLCSRCGIRPRMESFPLYSLCSQCWCEANGVKSDANGKVHVVPANHPSRHRGTKRTAK